jgi:catechol 2,3-dioxygenase-like lactoylglutathione lyase family enzyme
MPGSPLRWTATTLNSPDPKKLAEFYACLLGWEVQESRADWAMLTNPDGGIELYFHIEDVWTPPTWPSEPGKQIMQSHLEIEALSLDEGCAHAQACGATMAAFQPQDHVRVHLDPDGHPFCVYIENADD